MRYELLLLPKDQIGKSTPNWERSIPAPSTKETLRTYWIPYFEKELDLYAGVFLIVEENDLSPFTRKVYWSNIPDLKECSTYFDVCEFLNKFPERITALLTKPEEVSISTQEQDLFKLLGSKYDALLMAKTKINGVPTTAVCMLEKDDAGQDVLKPLAVLVNEQVFKMLTPPEDLLPEDGREN